MDILHFHDEFRSSPLFGIRSYGLSGAVPSTSGSASATTHDPHRPVMRLVTGGEEVDRRPDGRWQDHGRCEEVTENTYHIGWASYIHPVFTDWLMNRTSCTPHQPTSRTTYESYDLRSRGTSQTNPSSLFTRAACGVHGACGSIGGSIGILRAVPCKRFSL